MKAALTSAVFCTLSLACDKKPTDASAPDLAARVEALEKQLEARKPALDFLDQVYGDQQKQKEEQEASEPAEDAVFGVDVAGNAVDGPDDAWVTIIKAYDYACPYCQRVSDTMHELVKEYDGKVRVVYKNLVVHPDTAMPAHLGACAANMQGKFIAFNDAFWTQGFGPYVESRGQDTKAMSTEGVIEIAKGVGIDADKFQADMQSDTCKKRIQDDAAELSKFQVRATPSFFINGEFVGGALPKEGFKAIVDKRLKIAEASGVPAGEYYQREILGKGEKKFRSRRDPKPGA